MTKLLTRTSLLTCFFVAAASSMALAKDSKPKPKPAATEPEQAPAARPWAENVPESEQAKAISLATQGDELFTTNEYARAVELYEQALKHWQHPAIHFNLTTCLMRLGKFLQAGEHLTAALAYDGAALGSKELETAETYKQILANSLVTVKITTTQAGVEVTLDGEQLLSGIGASEKTVTSGSHALVATKSGYSTLTKSLSLNPGESYVDTISLVELSAANRLYERRWERTWLPWVIAGSGVGVALLGGASMLLARGDMDSFNRTIGENCKDGCSPDILSGANKADWVDDAYSTRDSAKLKNAIGLGLVAAGGAAIVTGLVMVALNQPREVEGGRPQLVFTPQLGGGGFAITGGF